MRNPAPFDSGPKIPPGRVAHWLDSIIADQAAIHRQMGITREMFALATQYSERDEVADAEVAR